MKLTVRLNIPVPPELKDLVDQAAYDAGKPTNQFVAEILQSVVAPNRPQLAIIPRKPMGRPRLRVVEAS